ncbi:MAG: phosphomethylpyrimidine synthase ThiC [Desulfovibrio sp.]|nr:phosphomethylpyrimidine synthase ThiC [Desulfovibrio sp.]
MTRKQQAEQGIITEDMAAVAAQEGLAPEFVRDELAKGTLVIPRNAGRKLEQPRAVGRGTSVKVNANIGASPYHSSLDEELAKLDAAVAAGADSAMDLSLGPDQIRIRRAVLEHSPVMVGTVPLYQTAFELSASKRDMADMTMDDFLTTVRRQAEEGVDFMTIHCGVTRSALEAMNAQGRLLDVVSRGGAFMVQWMRKNQRESPLYEQYDEILDILAEYDVTLSLGDGMRPGATADAGDCAQTAELLTLAALTRRAWERGVQVIIEGPGHVSMDRIADQMRQQKILCDGAPFYILGPLVTDVAAGYDHIAGAIGGAYAAMNGADFLCYVTPAEHLRLPSVQDVHDGTIASKIAAHAADLSRGRAASLERDRAMSRARKELDWKAQIELSIDPAKAKAYREQSEIGEDDVCTMCGEFCAIKRLNS